MPRDRRHVWINTKPGMGPANNTMKQLIKSATIYKVAFPEGCDLAASLSAELQQFREPESVEHFTTGSVVVPGTDEFVLDIAGQVQVFAVRLADKILPASVVAVEVDKRIAEIEKREDRIVGRKESAIIREHVTDELIARALVRHKTIRVFHDRKSGYMIVPSTSAAICDRITSHLVHSCGAVKTETIHVSDLKQGLTIRMQTWADDQSNDDEHYAVMGHEFKLAGDIALAGETTKAKFSVGDLAQAKQGVREALSEQMKVVEIGLQCADTEYEFRLTDGFKFKGIYAGVKLEDAEDCLSALKAQVIAELGPLIGVANKLVELFGFGKKPDDAHQIEAA